MSGSKVNLTFVAGRRRIEVLLRFALRHSWAVCRWVHWVVPHRSRLVMRVLVVRLIVHKLRRRWRSVKTVAVVVRRSLNWARRWPSLVLRLHISSGVLTASVHPIAGKVTWLWWRRRFPLKNPVHQICVYAKSKNKLTFWLLNILCDELTSFMLGLDSF